MRLSQRTIYQIWKLKHWRNNFRKFKYIWKVHKSPTSTRLQPLHSIEILSLTALDICSFNF